MEWGVDDVGCGCVWVGCGRNVGEMEVWLDVGFGRWD